MLTLLFEIDLIIFKADILSCVQGVGGHMGRQEAAAASVTRFISNNYKRKHNWNLTGTWEHKRVIVATKQNHGITVYISFGKFSLHQFWETTFSCESASAGADTAGAHGLRWLLGKCRTRKNPILQRSPGTYAVHAPWGLIPWHI